MSQYAQYLIDMGVVSPVIRFKNICFTIDLKKVKKGRFRINGVKNTITRSFVNEIMPIIYNIYVSTNETNICSFQQEVGKITEEFLIKNIIEIE